MVENLNKNISENHQYKESNFVPLLSIILSAAVIALCIAFIPGASSWVGNAFTDAWNWYKDTNIFAQIGIGVGAGIVAAGSALGVGYAVNEAVGKSGVSEKIALQQDKQLAEQKNLENKQVNMDKLSKINKKNQEIIVKGSDAAAKKTDLLQGQADEIENRRQYNEVKKQNVIFKEQNKLGDIETHKVEQITRIEKNILSPYPSKDEDQIANKVVEEFYKNPTIAQIKDKNTQKNILQDIVAAVGKEPLLENQVSIEKVNERKGNLIVAINEVLASRGEGELGHGIQLDVGNVEKEAAVKKGAVKEVTKNSKVSSDSSNKVESKVDQKTHGNKIKDQQKKSESKPKEIL